MKLVLVTGGFDPIHSGHISLLREAWKLGDRLIVGLNSDEWLVRKKGKAFMSFKERQTVIENLKMVHDVISFDDSDDTSCGAIFKLISTSGHGHEIIFANGGDRTEGNVPEYNTYHDKIKFVYGVGGDHKMNSSSSILEDWEQPKVKRQWGWYKVLQQTPNYKIKELVINPNSSLSMQRHFHRSENWYILKGICHMKTDGPAGIQEVELTPNRAYSISKETWHQGQNKIDAPCHILEIQHGEKCEESDIERKHGGHFTVDEIVEATKNILDNK